MIILHTLGDALILVGERKVRPSSPLVFASLLFLAMERGRRVPRAALQEMFFPNSDERSGAHSLRQLLYKLRQLGAPLESDPTTVSLPADRVQNDTSSEALATGLVDFLPDYHPAISDRFSEWLDRKRAETAKAVRTQLLSAIESHREVLNWPAVERDAQLLLHIDAFNEVGTFALAEAAAMTGRKAAAIKILSDYERETGRTDLRLPASLLRRRILQAVPEQVATLSPLPFVGRDVEVKELRKHIARARLGQPSMYVIGGEAGIGKTRLLTETVALAALEGVAVFTVRCQAHYISRPLSVFIELVPTLRAAPGALGVSPQSLVLLNSLTSHADDQASCLTDYGDGVARSQAMLSAVRDLVDAVTTEQPVVIAIEDAHWADRESLRELNQLVQQGDRSFMVICTTRGPESFPRSTAIDERTAIRRLKPLTSEVMIALAGHLLPTIEGRSATTEVIDWSVRSAGGNPLFLQMLCSHYAATGETNKVPPDVLTAVTRRVQHLPETHRRLLAICSLLGKHGTVTILQNLTEWTHLQLLDAVQELEDHGFIILVDDRLCIAHELLAQSVLSLVPAASTRVLHACIASALEAQYGASNDAALLWDCAEQWVSSGDSAKAIEFLIKCGRHAIEIGRAAETVNLLTRARQLARTEADASRVDGELVLAARSALQWDLAAESFVRWQSLHRHEHSSSHDSKIACVGLEASWFAKADTSLTIPTALRYSRESPHPTVRVEAARLLMAIAHDECDESLAAQAYRNVQSLIDEQCADHANRILPVQYHTIFGDRDVALELLSKLTADLVSFDNTQRLRVAANCGALYAILGEDVRALNLCLSYVPLAEAQGAKVSADWLLGLAVNALLNLDRIDEARSLHARSGSFFMMSGRVYDSLYLANDAEIGIGDGEGARASHALDQLGKLGITTLRFSAYLTGLKIRIAQAEPTFLLSAAERATACRLHCSSSRFASADGLTQAIATDLARLGETEMAARFVENYAANERRERNKLCRGLRAFVRQRDNRCTHTQ